MAALKFREMLYGSHPYGYSANGYPDTVQALTPADLEQFHRRHYGPQGMVFVVVGAVEAAAAVEQIEAEFGDWRNDQWQAPPTVPAATRPEGVQRLYHGIPEKTQSDIMMGWPGPERRRPDYMAASLANTILGVFGMMGRLGKNVREAQGLAYYAYSHLQGGLGPSPWLISTGVAPDKVDQAINSILDEVRRICEEPVSTAELADVQAYRTGSMPVSLETNDGLASIIADIVLFDLGLDYLPRFADMINAITIDGIQAAAQKYLSAENIAIAVVGPEIGEAAG
jgi:zinc protease